MATGWKQGVLVVDEDDEATHADRDDLLMEAHKRRGDKVARACIMDMVNVINTVDDIIMGMMKHSVRG
jgi:hypothetical protein